VSGDSSAENSGSEVSCEVEDSCKLRSAAGGESEFSVPAIEATSLSESLHSGPLPPPSLLVELGEYISAWPRFLGDLLLSIDSPTEAPPLLLDVRDDDDDALDNVADEVDVADDDEEEEAEENSSIWTSRKNFSPSERSHSENRWSRSNLAEG
jgi:hypothetical protein